MDRFDSGAMLFLCVFMFVMAVILFVAGETLIAIVDAVVGGILYATWRTYRAR